MNLNLYDRHAVSHDSDGNGVDWPAFVRQHDFDFDALPQTWLDAPHFGNAMVGSLLYQRTDRLCLEIFRADVHDHRDETFGWTAYSRPRFRIGHFELQTAGRLLGCRWRKDLWNAELIGTITTDRGSIGIRHFTHAIRHAIVTELSPDASEHELSWLWYPAPAETSRPGYPTDTASAAAYAARYGDAFRRVLKPFTPNPPGRMEARGEVSLWVQDLLAGGQYATAWAEAFDGGVRRQVVSIAHHYPGTSAAEEAVDTVTRVCGETEDSEFFETHRSWWHAYYRRGFVAIPDKPLESLYWQTIYRYGCCSRSGRSFVDTPGLWFQGGPWPYSTHDWNTQSSHWAVYAANRLEQGEELVNRLRNHIGNLIEAVYPEDWRYDSAYLALATAGDLIGDRRGDMRYYNLVGNLPWLLHNAWWQYRFSMDDGMLSETVMPCLRRAANLYFHMVEEGADGRIHLMPTYSPEAGECRDANFDLALFKWLCGALLKACERLGVDDPLAPRWREVIDRLVAFPAGDRGFMLGLDRAAPLGHRHLSHLLMIYPLHLVNIEQPESIDVLTASYDAVRTTDGSEGSSHHEMNAMLQTHAAAIGCVLGRGDDALDGLRRLAGELSRVGLWACGGNPCIESTLGAANIIQNMLLQSWSSVTSDDPGLIRIFPALPVAWADVEFHDLRTEGAFLVSARRVAGRTVWARVKSLAGEPCRVRWDRDEAVEAVGGGRTLLKRVSPRVYDIKLDKGGTVELKPSASGEG